MSLANGVQLGANFVPGVEYCAPSYVRYDQVNVHDELALWDWYDCVSIHGKYYN